MMETTRHIACIVQWRQGKYNRIVTLSKHNNVATFCIAPGFGEFRAYEVTSGFIEATGSHPIIAEQVHIIEDDENPYCKPKNPWIFQPLLAYPCKVDMYLTKQIPNSSATMDIHIVQPANDEEGMSDKALLLRYNRQFGQISFSRLQDMVKIGIIPKRLRKFRIPMCSACLHSKATKNNGGVKKA